MTPVRVSVAARELGVTPKQIRVWLRAGAPVVREQRPRLVDVEVLKKWRQGDQTIEKIAVALLDTIRREYGEGRKAHELVGIPEQKAAGVLLAAFERTHLYLTGQEVSLKSCPEAYQQLRRIARTNL